MGVKLVGKTEYKVANFEIVEKFGEIKKINKLTIPKSKYEAIKSEDVLSLYVDGVLQGKYIVDEIFIGKDRVEVRLYDYIAKLVRDYDLFNNGGDYRVEYNNTSAATILDDVLNGTIFSRGYAPSQLITVRGEYENRVKWIEGIAKACLYGYDSSGVVTTDYSSIAEVIDHCSWWTDFRSDKVHIGVPGAIRSGDNWMPLEIDITDYILDLSDINERIIKYNKIIVLGYGDGLNQVVGVAGSGAPVGVFVDRRITEQETADRKAQAILGSQKQPKSLRVKINPDLYFGGAIRLGSNVFINEPYEAAGTYRITSIRASYESVELGLESGADVKFSSEFADIKRALEINSVYLQGATNVSNFGGGWQAVDPDHPAKWTFYLPDSSVGFVRVNECFINVRGRAYRIWSKGAAAGATGEDANWGVSTIDSIGDTWDTNDISNNTWYKIGDITPSSLPKDVYAIFVNIKFGVHNGDSNGFDCGLTFELRKNGTAIYTTPEYWLTVGAYDYKVGNCAFIVFNPGSKDDTYEVYWKGRYVANQGTADYRIDAYITTASRHDHGTHTHTPEPGIYETGDYPSNVAVKLYNSAYPSGVTVISGITGGSDFDEEKIDISSYVATGKNEIEVTSDSLGMVQVDGFYRIFIKTK